jgi:hypothetical protein
MSEDRIIKKLYMSKPEGRRSVGRPKMRWLYDIEEDLRKMRISGWKGKTRGREEWKSVLINSEFCIILYSLNTLQNDYLLRHIMIL